MNSKNSKTSESYGLLFNLSEKINLKKVINMLLYQISAFSKQFKTKNCFEINDGSYRAYSAHSQIKKLQ